jgi:uncharacterized protein (UPF0212 family)
MSKCEGCVHWIIARKTVYGDGAEIVRWSAPSGKGHCNSLGIEVTADFGCNRFLEGDEHVEKTVKAGSPWQHFTMIACPDCGGKGDGGRGHRCAGTGLVRLYDDGHVGDEQTRRHPKENPVDPKCPGCGGTISEQWKHCPACGSKLWVVAETEVVALDLPPLAEAAQ